MKFNETIKKGTVFATLAGLFAFLLNTSSPWIVFLVVGVYVGWIRTNEDLKEAVINSVFTALYTGLILGLIISIITFSLAFGVATFLVSMLLIPGGIIGWFTSLLIKLGNSNKSNSK